MAIPDFDEHGLLPAGVHECSMADVARQLGWNSHRRSLVNRLHVFIANEIRPDFPDPVDVDGSFVTDKEKPEDVDVVLAPQEPLPFGNASCPSPGRSVTLSAFGQLAPSEVRQAARFADSER